MVQLQVEAEKLQLSCNVLPTGLAPEGIKLSNLWIQLAHESKGLIAQDYLQGKVDEAGLLQLEVHRLGINELGRYRLIVKYSYESPERSAEGRTKYECILPAFEVLREERSQRLGTSELVAQGIIVQPLVLPTAQSSSEATASLSPELLETLQALKRETAAMYDALISQLESGYYIATGGDVTDAWGMRDKYIIEGTGGGAVYSQYGRILTQADYDELKGLIQNLQSEVASLRQQLQSK